MVDFLLRHAMFWIVVGAVGFGVALLLTSRRSLVRSWLLATPDRIAMIGFGTIVLLWLGVVVFNRLGA